MIASHGRRRAVRVVAHTVISHANPSSRALMSK